MNRANVEGNITGKFTICIRDLKYQAKLDAEDCFGWTHTKMRVGMSCDIY